MGARGPIPKREAQRRRRNKTKTQKASAEIIVDVSIEPFFEKPIEKMTGTELDAVARKLAINGWNSKERVAKKREMLAAHVPTPDAGGIPEPDDSWHEAAKRWYEGLRRSGQSAFYQPSDWAWAWIVAESISRDLKPQVVGIVEDTGEVVRAVIPMKGASLAAYLKAMTALLATEGDRRRAGVELERASGKPDPADSDGDVTSLDDYRARFAG